MIGDILLMKIPQALRSDLYAAAALAAIAIIVIGHMLDFPYGVSALAGGILCVGLRFMAIKHGWHLPTSRLSAKHQAENDASGDQGK
jgi:uncharacterized membrane protein YeiH